MKNLVSLAAVMLITANIFAQTGDPAPRITYDTLPPMPDTLAINAARKGHFVFFDVGGGMNNVAYQLEDTCGKKAPGLGISARFGYRYYFTPNWGIGFGINYNTYQGIANLDFAKHLGKTWDTLTVIADKVEREFKTVFNLKERTTVSAIDLPIGLYYQQALGSRFRIGAGVNVNFTQLLTKKYKTASGSAKNIS